EELRMPSSGVRFLYDGCNGRIGSHHHHCLRTLSHNGAQTGIHIHTVSGKCSQSHGRSMMLLQSEFDSVENSLAKSIVLIDHTDLVYVVFPKLVYLLPGLVVVACTYVDDVVLERLVQHLRSGEEADDGNLLFLRHGHVNFSSRSSYEEAESENSLFGHALEAARGLVRIIVVVEGEQLDLAPEDAAFIVDGIQIHGRAHDCLLAQEVGRTIERGTRSDQNTVVSDAWNLSMRIQREGEGKKQQ